jgi:hypothetical protein
VDAVQGKTIHENTRIEYLFVRFRVVWWIVLGRARNMVHLHNLSGGVLGGDQLDVTVEVGAPWDKLIAAFHPANIITIVATVRPLWRQALLWGAG